METSLKFWPVCMKAMPDSVFQFSQIFENCCEKWRQFITIHHLTKKHEKKLNLYLEKGVDNKQPILFFLNTARIFPFFRISASLLFIQKLEKNYAHNFLKKLYNYLFVGDNNCEPKKEFYIFFPLNSHRY
ncbi:hypothetical protein [Methanosarcina acetivorans]|uniref:hypothetical protein n=1 Tax=Methanosarcina acetivorans TaxID=2214 RepID=UPI0012FF23C1|nr:hypothetical protein [Methanosarcina acetivorans]